VGWVVVLKASAIDRRAGKKDCGGASVSYLCVAAEMVLKFGWAHLKPFHLLFAKR
jgi:hypothetical protein